MRVLRNLTVRFKLILGFAVMIILSLIIGAVGIFGMNQIEKEDTALYVHNTLPLGFLAQLNDNIASQRSDLVAIALFTQLRDFQVVPEIQAELHETEAEFEEILLEYRSTITADYPEELATYEKIENYYHQDFAAVKTRLNEALATGDIAAIKEAAYAADEAGDYLSSLYANSIDTNSDSAALKTLANTALAKKMVLVVIVLLVVAVALTILLAFAIANIIAPPLRRIMAIADQVATAGNLEFAPEIISEIRKDTQFQDEISGTARAFINMIDNLVAQGRILEQVAAGDLTVMVKKAGPQDTLGNAIESMINNLNSMFGRVNLSTEQVTAGSTQIADGSQALSQGATEQASAVEQLSAAISEVLTQTQANTKSAHQGLEAVTEASRLMGDTVEYMRQMQQAMGGISSSSEEIAKIIKVIDDIAFQTNILALNAAVEAARAGQHGKGFAVVADEVRNLASKSAEAAKETAVLIQDSLTHVNLGRDIVEKTSESIDGVAVSAQQIQGIITEINAASLQQENAIVQINTGIEQVSQVVQTNSATAEESAASSEELSAQAQMLKGLVAHFKLSGTPASHSVDMPMNMNTDGYSDNYSSSYSSPSPSYPSTPSYSSPAPSNYSAADRYSFSDEGF